MTALVKCKSLQLVIAWEYMCVMRLNRCENGSKANQVDYRSREVACIDGDPTSGRVVDAPPQTRRISVKRNFMDQCWRNVINRILQFANVWRSYLLHRIISRVTTSSRNNVFTRLSFDSLRNLITRENMIRLCKLFLIIKYNCSLLYLEEHI